LFLTGIHMVLMIEIVGRASARHVGLKVDLQINRTMNQWIGIRNNYLEYIAHGIG